MQKIIMIGGVLTICFLMSIQGMAQQGYSLVYDLYYQLILYPGRGDQLISSNKALFDSRFYSCLSVIRQRAQQAAQQHTAKCNGYADPFQKAKCEQNNEGAKIFRWTNEIRSVCQGDMLWSETLTGQSSILAKRQLETLLPGQYEEIVRMTLPQFKYIYLCE